MLTLDGIVTKVCSIPSLDYSKADEFDNLCAIVKELLTDSGIVVVQLQFEDRSGSTFLKLVEFIGKPEGHNADGVQVWDIKYNSSIDPEKAARSLTLRDFPMHTDAAFDLPPPKYIGLYVVQEDRFGAGISRFIDGHKLIKKLSLKSLHILQSTFFTLQVPEEFRKERAEVHVPLIDSSGNFRYRREIIVDENCSAMQLAALDELEQLLANPELTSSMFLPTGSLLLVDNGRFLHARSQVLDKERHLLRMRFQANWNQANKLFKRRSA